MEVAGHIVSDPGQDASGLVHQVKILQGLQVSTEEPVKKTGCFVSRVDVHINKTKCLLLKRIHLIGTLQRSAPQRPPFPDWPVV